MTIIPVIMCGGAGTRMWPESRESYPKQFLKLFAAIGCFLAGPLHLNEFALAGHHHIAVHFRIAILDIFQVQTFFAINDANTNGSDTRLENFMNRVR
jgi:hypothetical protein